MTVFPLELATARSMDWFGLQEDCEQISENLYQTSNHIIQTYEDHVLVWNQL